MQIMITACSTLTAIIMLLQKWTCVVCNEVHVILHAIKLAIVVVFIIKCTMG